MLGSDWLKVSHMTEHYPLIGYSRTCMFGELFKELVSVPVLGDVANKQAMVVKGNGHTKLFSFPQFIVI